MAETEIASGPTEICAFRGVMHLALDARTFAGVIKHEVATDQLSIELDRWRNGCVQRGPNSVRMLEAVAFDARRGTLSFTVHENESDFVWRVELQRASDGTLIGAATRNHHLAETAHYPCQAVLTQTYRWQDPQQLASWFRQQRSDGERDAALLQIVAKRAASPIIRGPFRLMPGDFPKGMEPRFGKSEVESTARIFLAYCQGRPSADGRGSWDPCDREAFKGFRAGYHEAYWSKSGDVFEGLTIPFEDTFNGDKTGGGWLVIQDDGTIGTTEGFVATLEEELQRGAIVRRP